MRGVKSISKEKKKLISILNSCAVAQLCIEASQWFMDPGVKL